MDANALGQLGLGEAVLFTETSEPVRKIGGVAHVSRIRGENRSVDLERQHMITKI